MPTLPVAKFSVSVNNNCNSEARRHSAPALLLSSTQLLLNTTFGKNTRVVNHTPVLPVIQLEEKDSFNPKEDTEQIKNLLIRRVSDEPEKRQSEQTQHFQQKKRKEQCIAASSIKICECRRPESRLTDTKVKSLFPVKHLVKASKQTIVNSVSKFITPRRCTSTLHDNYLNGNRHASLGISKHKTNQENKNYTGRIESENYNLEHNQEKKPKIEPCLTLKCNRTKTEPESVRVAISPKFEQDEGKVNSKQTESKAKPEGVSSHPEMKSVDSSKELSQDIIKPESSQIHTKKVLAELAFMERKAKEEVENGKCQLLNCDQPKPDLEFNIGATSEKLGQESEKGESNLTEEETEPTVTSKNSESKNPDIPRVLSRHDGEQINEDDINESKKKHPQFASQKSEVEGPKSQSEKCQLLNCDFTKTNPESKTNYSEESPIPYMNSGVSINPNDSLYEEDDDDCTNYPLPDDDPMGPMCSQNENTTYSCNSWWDDDDGCENHEVQSIPDGKKSNVRTSGPSRRGGLNEPLKVTRHAKGKSLEQHYVVPSFPCCKAEEINPEDESCRNYEDIVPIDGKTWHEKVMEYDYQDMVPDMNLLITKKNTWDFKNPELIRALFVESETNAIGQWKAEHMKIRTANPKLRSNWSSTLRISHLRSTILKKRRKERRLRELMKLDRGMPEFGQVVLRNNITSNFRHSFCRNHPPVPSHIIHYYQQHKRPPFKVVQLKMKKCGHLDR